MSLRITEKIRLHRRDRSANDRPYVSRWLASILFPIHALFMKRYFKIEISGEHNIPTTGPFIMTPLHRSRWDPFVLYCAVPHRLLYFMVSHVEIAGLQGWFMTKMGSYPIDAQRPSPSAIRSFQEVISSGDALVIFPEGNLYYYEPGEVHPLKPGAAWLARKFQEGCGDEHLPIIPVRLVYGDRLLRAGSRVRIVIEKPIFVSDYTALPPRVGMLALTAALQAVLGEVINDTSTADSLRCARRANRESHESGPGRVSPSVPSGPACGTSSPRCK